MEISIGSYKVRVEILVLIVIVFWIMFGHLLCSCSRVTMFEGLAMMKEGLVGRRVAANNVYQNNNPTTTTTEGFIGANNVTSGPEFAGANTPDYIIYYIYNFHINVYMKKLLTILIFYLI